MSVAGLGYHWRRDLFAEAIPGFGDDIGYCQTGGFCVDFDFSCSLRLTSVA